MSVPSEQQFSSGKQGRATTFLALMIFLAAAASVYADVWREGAREAIPSIDLPWIQTVVRADQLMVVAIVNRNARAFITKPLDFFDTNYCFPAKDALALGEPMITMGVLAVPPYLAGADPILTYNIVLVLMCLLGAMAMYFLVAEWTSSRAAGIAAGLLYAFHPIRLGDPLHPYIYDTTWTVLALMFARRLFAHGRWRDTFGLAASASLQIGTSFYPFVSACLLGFPFFLWLLFRYRFRHVRAAQVAGFVALVGLAGAFTFAPFLDLRSSGVLFTRGVQMFRPWSAYLPGGGLFLGWPCLVLVAVSLLMARRRSLGGIAGDPRWVLLVGAILVALAGAGPGGTHFVGPHGIPNLWGMLSALLPGFETVRAPRVVATGYHLAACILAGIGFAGLLRLWRWRLSWVPVVVSLAIIFSVTLRPTFLGMRSPLAYTVLRIKLDPKAIEFFKVLEKRGDSGPIFEWPLIVRDGLFWFTTAPQVLLSAYHHRRTVACYTSFPQKGRIELERINKIMPDRAAILDLHRMGFKTIVFHHDRPSSHLREKRLKFDREARRAGGTLRRIYRTPSRSAYRIDLSDRHQGSP